MAISIPQSVTSFTKSAPLCMGEHADKEQMTAKTPFANRQVKTSYGTLIKLLAITILKSPKDLLSRLITICPIIGRDVINFLEKKITKTTDAMTQKIDESRDKLINIAEQEHDLSEEELIEAERLVDEELQLMLARNTAENRLDKIKQTAQLI